MAAAQGVLPCPRSSEIAFTALPAVGSGAMLRIGVFGDLGDTSNSSETLSDLMRNSPHIVLNTGDMVRIPLTGFPFPRSSQACISFHACRFMIWPLTWTRQCTVQRSGL